MGAGPGGDAGDRHGHAPLHLAVLGGHVPAVREQLPVAPYASDRLDYSGRTAEALARESAGPELSGAFGAPRRSRRRGAGYP